VGTDARNTLSRRWVLTWGERSFLRRNSCWRTGLTTRYFEETDTFLFKVHYFRPSPILPPPPTFISRISFPYPTAPLSEVLKYLSNNRHYIPPRKNSSCEVVTTAILSVAEVGWHFCWFQEATDPLARGLCKLSVLPHSLSVLSKFFHSVTVYSLFGLASRTGVNPLKTSGYYTYHLS
jgi:hypothetical protein